MSGITTAAVGALLLAALSTLGDFIWATWIPEHRAPYGVAHGTLLFLAAGAYLGRLAGRVAGGAAGGAAIGLGAAGIFYLVAPLIGYYAMFAAWPAVWVALAFLYGRLAAGSPRAGTAPWLPPAVAARGLIAAAASGLAFYAVSSIWRPFDPQGWDYAEHFGAWALAFFPGLASILARRRP